MEPLLSVQRRPPSISDIRLPQSAKGVLEHHSERFCLAQLGMQQQRAVRLAVHPERGGAILADSGSIYQKNNNQNSFYIVHPEWHLEPCN